LFATLAPLVYQSFLACPSVEPVYVSHCVCPSVSSAQTQCDSPGGSTECYDDGHGCLVQQGSDFDFVDKSLLQPADEAVVWHANETFIDDEDHPFSVLEFGSGEDVSPLPESAGRHPLIINIEVTVGEFDMCCVVA